MLNNEVNKHFSCVKRLNEAECREDDHVWRVWLDLWADSRLRHRLLHAAWAGLCFHRTCSSANGPGPPTTLASQQRSLPRCNNLLFCPTSCRCSCPAASEPDGGQAAWSSTSRQSAEKCDQTSASRDSASEAVAVLRGWVGEFHLVTPTHINMQRVPRPWICNLKGMAVSRCKILNNLWGDK